MRLFHGTSCWLGDAESPADHVSTLLRKPEPSTVVVLVDENAPHAWVDELRLPAGSESHVLPGGESQKTLSTLTDLIERVQLTVSKQSVVLAIGGGATLDLVGLLCGLLYRGLRWISVPTTMMAMSDAAYGGKTAVNHGVKNQIGTYHHPDAIYVHPRLLSTLPELHMRSGLVEVAKLAVFDAELRQTMAPLEGVPDWQRAGEFAVMAAVRKLELLATDPYEEATASVLVYGHPFANAFEMYDSGLPDEPLTHGAAVALGIAFSAWLAESSGARTLSHREQLALVSACLDPFSYARDHLPPPATLEMLLRRDKYTVGGIVHLPATFGRPRYDDVPIADVLDAYATWRQWMLGRGSNAPTSRLSA